jgi:hypothetical protein
MRRVLRAALLVFVTACARAPRAAPLDPARVAAWRAEIAQLVVDSIYRRAAPVSIAVVAVPVDTTCGPMAPLRSCAPLAQRWGVDSTWWSGADAAESDAARRDLLTRAGREAPLQFAATDVMVPVSADAVPPIGAPNATWHAFRAATGGSAGAVRFSPVGFGPGARRAVLFVDWRCGPTCGHSLSVALSRPDSSGWQLRDILLLSSAQGNEARPDTARRAAPPDRPLR